MITMHYNSKFTSLPLSSLWVGSTVLPCWVVVALPTTNLWFGTSPITRQPLCCCVAGSTLGGAPFLMWPQVSLLRCPLFLFFFWPVLPKMKLHLLVSTPYLRSTSVVVYVGSPSEGSHFFFIFFWQRQIWFQKDLFCTKWNVVSAKLL